jgi:hypothetical protein
MIESMMAGCQDEPWHWKNFPFRFHWKSVIENQVILNSSGIAKKRMMAFFAGCRLPAFKIPSLQFYSIKHLPKWLQRKLDDLLRSSIQDKAVTTSISKFSNACVVHT